MTSHVTSLQAVQRDILGHSDRFPCEMCLTCLWRAGLAALLWGLLLPHLQRHFYGAQDVQGWTPLRHLCGKWICGEFLKLNRKFSFLAPQKSFPFKFPELSPSLCTSVTCPLLLALPFLAELLIHGCPALDILPNPSGQKRARKPPWEWERERQRLMTGSHTVGTDMDEKFMIIKTKIPEGTRSGTE